MRKFVNLQSKYKNSKEEIFLMEENNVDIEKVKQIIQKLKIAIFLKSKARKNARQKAVKRGFWVLKVSAMRL